MARLELPGSPVAVAHRPDRAAAVGLGPPHNGLLIVGRVVGGVSNVDPGGRRHCRLLLLFYCLLFLVINSGIISHSTLVKSKNKNLGVQHRLSE